MSSVYINTNLNIQRTKRAYTKRLGVSYGRPAGQVNESTARFLGTLERHLSKCYDGKDFTISDISKSLALQLRNKKQPKIFIAKCLEKLDNVQQEGTRKGEGRGKPAKLYKLV